MFVKKIFQLFFHTTKIEFKHYWLYYNTNIFISEGDTGAAGITLGEEAGPEFVSEPEAELSASAFFSGFVFLAESVHFSPPVDVLSFLAEVNSPKATVMLLPFTAVTLPTLTVVCVSFVVVCDEAAEVSVLSAAVTLKAGRDVVAIVRAQRQASVRFVIFIVITVLSCFVIRAF